MENTVDVAHLIQQGGVLYDVEGSTPQEIYKNICSQLKLPAEISADTVYNALCAREEVLSTAVGNGIALPHARTPIMKEEKNQQIVVAYLKNPIDMNAPDERLVDVMFVLLTSNSQSHLKLLSSLAGIFREPRFRKALEIRADEPKLLTLIKELD